MSRREFHNALRILLNLDRHDLVEHGVMGADEPDAWWAFGQDPYRWFIRADDATAEKLWRLIEARQPDKAPS